MSRSRRALAKEIIIKTIVSLWGLAVLYALYCR